MLNSGTDQISSLNLYFQTRTKQFQVKSVNVVKGAEQRDPKPPSAALGALVLRAAARRRLLASLGGVMGGARRRLAVSSPQPQLPLLPPLLHLADVGGEQRLERRDQSGEGPEVAEANLRRCQGQTAVR